MSPRFPCGTPVVENFSSDFLQAIVFLLFQLLKQPRIEKAVTKQTTFVKIIAQKNFKTNFTNSKTLSSFLKYINKR